MLLVDAIQRDNVQYAVVVVVVVVIELLWILVGSGGGFVRKWRAERQD